MWILIFNVNKIRNTKKFAITELFEWSWDTERHS